MANDNKNQYAEKIALIKRIIKEIGVFAQVNRWFDPMYAQIFLCDLSKYPTIDDVISHLAKMGLESELISYLFDWGKTEHPFRKGVSDVMDTFQAWSQVNDLFRRKYNSRCSLHLKSTTPT